MDRGRDGGRGGGVGGGAVSQPDFLQWGNRKRLRCVKIQVTGADKTKVRRVVRSDRDQQPSQTPLFSRPFPHRVLRSSETLAVAMRSTQGQAAYGCVDRPTISDRAGQKIDGGVPSGGNGAVATSTEEKKCGSSSGGSEGTAWPKFVIALSNREKEEDFMIFKGRNKLPQRPKKHAKCIQRTLNLVCPGSWLCDLTRERYEVREKKVSKKRPRGLKAMGNMESDSE